jgi:peptidoglycan/LPS O-acetylase OafA/YrhL
MLFNETNRRTNFQIYSGTKLYMFRAVPLPIIRSYPLYIRHWHMLCRFGDSLRVGSGMNCSSILILHASCRQTCITCAITERTVANS